MEESLNDTDAQQRWVMNRAGIFNFWVYHDDEEFALEGGRLILRGTNGAGKSVTMQSFLPLVLDGDKRPRRLDPFGSRDRKIEYYLLGEDEQHSDRIGYLWLEFYHPGKVLYKTIGIGLRARRGAASVSFWGFVLDDGRRINQDFWLYDRHAWLEGRGKFPLERKELEERIGAGGEVVYEQKAYQQLVNKALFGFYDSEAFGDLLELLIQLRSPKLSKDFKPTAIYDILTKALPPLQEDELRPLSEVMEDMDQIADRLEELKLHQTELEKLNQTYDRYNRLLLLNASEAVLDAKAQGEQAVREAEGVRGEASRAQSQMNEAELRLQAGEGRMQEVRSDLDVLNRHDGIGKQLELQTQEAAIVETERYEANANQRLQQASLRLSKLEAERSIVDKTMREGLEEQRELLEGLEALARDAEFYGHDVYHRYWHGEPPEQDDIFASWRGDSIRHRESLEAAQQVAEQEREAALKVQDQEGELGSLRQVRDAAERKLADAEREAESGLSEQKERIVQWSGQLSLLPLSGEQLQRILRALSELGRTRRDYGAVRSLMVEAADSARRTLLESQLRLEAESKEVEIQRDGYAAELKAWRESREPEPTRRPVRERSRREREAGAGAPLFAVCDFVSHLEETKRAQIEATLEASGLLDAWIAPEGQLGLASGGDEAWIESRPVEFGYTLADLLRPVPSPESGLTEEVIDRALRTFAWSESDQGGRFDLWSIGESSASIGFGSFQLGPLQGQVQMEGQAARYIGKEARTKFKQAEMERLKAEIESCDDALTKYAAQLASLDERREQLDAESGAFPGDDKLQTYWENATLAASRLQAILEQEQQMAERLREKTAVWQQLRTELAVRTSEWTRLKRSGDLRDAVQGMRSYIEELSALLSAWRQYRQAENRLQRLKEESEEQRESAEAERDLLEELATKRQGYKVKAESLRKWMKEQGIDKLYEQIAGLEAERRTLEQLIQQENRKVREAERELAVLEERIRARQERVDQAAYRVKTALGSWHRELKLGLVEGWRDILADESDQAFAFGICQDIRSTLQSLSGRSEQSAYTSLSDQFHAVKHLLLDYSLELIEDPDTSRRQVFSMRDRSRPQTPAMLLQEIRALIEEQSGLLGEKDRELYEEIILRSVGKTIRQRIQRAGQWIDDMNLLMAERNTSSGLRLQLNWVPKAAQSEQELNAEQLVGMLLKDARLLHETEIEQMMNHFRSRVQWAKQAAQEERESLRKHIYDLLDYRTWFQFELRYKKGDAAAPYRELTDSRFNVLSGGEKAMSMYIPLFAATSSRYADASADAPRIISLDEAFAGVDDENIRDLFALLTDMDFDYMMTSQVLWGCYDTVPKLSIAEIYRPKDADYVTLFRYRWNGERRVLVEPGSPVEV